MIIFLVPDSRYIGVRWRIPARFYSLCHCHCRCRCCGPCLLCAAVAMCLRNELIPTIIIAVRDYESFQGDFTRNLGMYGRHFARNLCSKILNFRKNVTRWVSQKCAFSLSLCVSRFSFAICKYNCRSTPQLWFVFCVFG